MRKRRVFLKLKRKILTLYTKRQARVCGADFQTNHYTKLNRHTYLGDHVNLNGMKITGDGECHIGNYFHSGRECLILTQNHNYDHGKTIPYDTEKILKNVIIEDFVWMGSRVIVLPGAHIGRGAVIQAGAVVSGEIPECAVAGGNPARVFKYRDREHFRELLEKEAFL